MLISFSTVKEQISTMLAYSWRLYNSNQTNLDLDFLKSFLAVLVIQKFYLTIIFHKKPSWKIHWQHAQINVCVSLKTHIYWKEGKLNCYIELKTKFFIQKAEKCQKSHKNIIKSSRKIKNFLCKFWIEKTTKFTKYWKENLNMVSFY